MNNFDISRITRGNILGIMNDLTVEQLNTIPTGFNNNIIWHVGHILATQQKLTYALSGLDMLLSDNIIAEFGKGTKPEVTYSAEDIDELAEIFLEAIDQTEVDYELELMTNFKSYETSYGVTLNSIEDAIQFNTVHEGLHLGSIMAIRKLV